jgi:hypothetical protein
MDFIWFTTILLPLISLLQILKENFEPNTTTVATLENRKNKTDSRNDAFISKFGSKYKANENFQMDYDVFLGKMTS